MNQLAQLIIQVILITDIILLIVGIQVIKNGTPLMMHQYTKAPQKIIVKAQFLIYCSMQKNKQFEIRKTINIL